MQRVRTRVLQESRQIISFLFEFFLRFSVNLENINFSAALQVLVLYSAQDSLMNAGKSHKKSFYIEIGFRGDTCETTTEMYLAYVKVYKMLNIL